MPAGTDVAYFDGDGLVNCTFSGAISCQGLVTVAAYTKAIDLNGQTFTFTTSGMVLDNGIGSTFVLGAAVIEITGGPLDNRHSTGWNEGTSDITLKGTCTITGPVTGKYYKLTFAASSTITIVTAAVQATYLLTLNSAVVLNANLNVTAAGDLVINSGASFSGASQITLNVSTSGHGLITLSSATTPIIGVRRPVAGTRLAAGTYTSAVKLYNDGSASTLRLDAGNYVFNGGLEIENTHTTALTFDASTNAVTGITTTTLTIDLDSTGNITLTDSGQAVNWTITGNVVDERTVGAGTFTWIKGTGTITFNGSADQNVDLMDQTVEDIVINKSAGNFVLSGGFTTDSFTGTSTGTGDFDPNGQTITVSGACDWAAAFLFDSAADCLNACTWVITGAFTCNSQTLKGTAAWYLQCHGTAVASGAGAVAWCDASGTGHTAITATGWTDNANNTNWTFGGVSRPAHVIGGGIAA